MWKLYALRDMLIWKWLEKHWTWRTARFQALSFTTCISGNLSLILPYTAHHLKPCYLPCKSYSSSKWAQKQILYVCIVRFFFPFFFKWRILCPFWDFVRKMVVRFLLRRCLRTSSAFADWTWAVHPSQSRRRSWQSWSFSADPPDP